MTDISAGASRVHRTAQAELAVAFKKTVRPGRVVLGLIDELPSSDVEIRPTLLKLRALAGEADAFVVLNEHDTLLIVGSTPRGLLNAVFEVRDIVAFDPVLRTGLVCQGRFHFRQRIFHQRFMPWPGERADVRSIAQMGASHCLVNHDWSGSRRSLQGYVTSPVFPLAVPRDEVATNHAALKKLVDDCADYGLGVMLWLTELPCQGGPWLTAERRAEFLERFPAEVLSDSGTYEGKVLCFSHPRVQEFYRDLMQRFFREFPQIETLFIFGQDSGGEFCDTTLCPRCRGLSRIQQRDRLLNFLIHESGQARPGLRVLTTGWHWDADGPAFLRHQAALPGASGVYFAAQTDGWQCERQSHDLMHDVRRVCRERGQLFIGYDNFHWGDDTVHGLGDIQDFPLGIGAKVRRWHELGADGVFDHWGNLGEDVWNNSVACREFFLNPVADPTDIARKIARLQYGEAAGSLVLGAWQALEQAHRRQSSACTWPPRQWPMWYLGRVASPIPDDSVMADLQKTQLATRHEGGSVYNPPSFEAALQAISDACSEALPHYLESARLLERAEAATDDDAIGYSAWWNGTQPTPTRRQHLRRQRLYVESMAIAGREIGIQFGLYALWERTGRNVATYSVQSAELLREDIAACGAAAIFFAALGKPAAWPAQFEAKVKRIEEFLAKLESE